MLRLQEYQRISDLEFPRIRCPADEFVSTAANSNLHSPVRIFIKNSLHSENEQDSNVDNDPMDNHDTDTW